MRQVVATSVLLSLLGAGWLAQQPSRPEIQVSARPYVLPPLVLAAETNLVETTVVVRGRDGDAISGLARDQFRILDNGAERAVSAFSVNTGPPPPRLARGGWAQAPPPNPAPAAQPPAPSAPAPARSLALFFDDVNTVTGDLGNARIAALRFVREALAPGDRVAIFTASGYDTQGFTGDRGALTAAIGEIRIHPRQSDSEVPCPRITPYQAYMIIVLHDPQAMGAAKAEALHCPGTGRSDGDGFGRVPIFNGTMGDGNEEILAQAQSTWDQAESISRDTLEAITAAVDALRTEPGSRVLLVASGGFLNGGFVLGEAQEQLVTEALHAGVVINGLDAKGLYAEAPGRPLNEATDSGVLPLATYLFEETSRMDMHQAQIASMAEMAASTGGLMFENSNDLFLGFYQLGLAPEVSYSLGFSPGVMPHDGKYHKLKLELTGVKNATLEYRPGYFDPPSDAAPSNLDQRIAEAMRSTAVEAGGPGALDAKLAAWRDPAGVQAEAHVNITKLPLLAVAGRREEKLFLVVGLFDSQGKFVSGKLGEMALALTPDTYRRLAQQGLDMNLTIAASPGARYRVRIVALERNHGTLCAGNLTLQAP